MLPGSIQCTLVSRIRLLQLTLILSFLILPSKKAASEDTNAAPSASATLALSITNDPDQNLRVYLRLQEQLHAALLAVEQARLEASIEAQTNASLLASRLSALERTLEQERTEQRQAEQKASRAFTMLAMLALGLGLAALILTAVLQNRGMNRLAEIALGPRPGQSGGFPGFGSLPDAHGPLLLSGGVKRPDGDRLLATISRLEKYIHELERSARIIPDSGAAPESEASNGTTSSFVSSVAAVRSSDPIPGLLGKAQTLLHLGEADKALQCFDEVIARAPDNAEAHLRRGLALEKLQRPKDALAAYDQSIALSPFHTLASLRKAEILTRQERFSEALECYEQALRSQQKA
jgi:tetratricopeptide (TPR) repeat protein